MKSNDFIKKTAEQVKNEELRERLAQDLVEHVEDREEDGEPGAAEAVLGDPALIARQVDAPATRAVIGADVLLSGVVGMITMILSSLLPSFTDWDFAEPAIAAIGTVMGFALWLSAAFLVYLALHRRYISHHGISVTWFLLMTIAFIAPWAFLTMTETILVHLNDRNTYATVPKLMQEMAARVLLLSTFVGAGYIAARKMTLANRILTPLRKLAPFAIAIFTTVAVALTVSGGTSSVAVLPFVIPMMVLYLLWGMLSIGAGALAFAVGLPLVTGFWVVTAVLIAAGALYPLIRALRRKPIAWPARLLAGVVVPMFVMLPFIPGDQPQVSWSVPEVWSWEHLERKQLNVTYPWNASLMRRNDGVNTGYAANVENGAIVVAQDRSTMTTITKQGIDTRRSEVAIDWSTTGWYGPTVPAGFACNGTDLQEISDTHNNTTSPLGMFGMGCVELTYYGKVVANISHGTLIDLDLADDGLLAVSINMGSYDPTYVYVVDIAELLQ